MEITTARGRFLIHADGRAGWAGRFRVWRWSTVAGQWLAYYHGTMAEVCRELGG